MVGSLVSAVSFVHLMCDSSRLELLGNLICLVMQAVPFGCLCW